MLENILEYLKIHIYDNGYTDIFLLDNSNQGI
jgi:hypothetical protein